MLPAGRRLRRSDEFTAVVRGGRRAGSSCLVVHLLPGPPPPGAAPSPPARAGLVVNRAVGGSVVRNRVARRLRALLAPRLAALPAGTRVVVRALPPAAAASSAALGEALDAALRRAARPRPSRAAAALP